MAVRARWRDREFDHSSKRSTALGRLPAPGNRGAAHGVEAFASDRCRTIVAAFDECSAAGTGTRTRGASRSLERCSNGESDRVRLPDVPTARESGSSTSASTTSFFRAGRSGSWGAAGTQCVRGEVEDAERSYRGRRDVPELRTLASVPRRAGAIPAECPASRRGGRAPRRAPGGPLGRLHQPSSAPCASRLGPVPRRARRQQG